MTHPATITKYDGWTCRFIPFETVTDAQALALSSLGRDLNQERNPPHQRPRYIPSRQTPGGWNFIYADAEASTIEARIHKALELKGTP